MKNTSLRIFSSIFLGIILGASAAIQFETHLVISLLMILGGGVFAWFVYDFKQAIQAIPKAWKIAVGWDVGSRIKQLFKIKGTFLLGAISSGSSFVLLVLIEGYSKEFFSKFFILEFFYNALLLCLFICTILLFVSSIASSEYDNDKDKEFVSTLSLWAIKFFNPVVLPFTIIFWVGKLCFYEIPRFLLRKRMIILNAIVKGFLFLFRTVPVKLYQFLITFIRLIHSDIRLICLVDTIIGASIGFKFHMVFVSAVLGGLFGVFNYWVVGIKILKLKPKI